MLAESSLAPGLGQDGRDLRSGLPIVLVDQVVVGDDLDLAPAAGHPNQASRGRQLGHPDAEGLVPAAGDPEAVAGQKGPLSLSCGKTFQASPAAARPAEPLEPVRVSGIVAVAQDMEVDIV